MEEEVNGISVLVPKVYLSKETLASLDDIKGNQINAGKELNINALAVNNTGSLLGEKGVTITTDNLISESMRNGAYADISGENITIYAKDDIINRGGNIGADKNLILNSENGSILNETKVVINRNTHRDTITDIAGIGNMSGDNVKISVGNSFTNAGGQVQGNKDVNISAGKDINLTSVETVTRKEIGSSRNYTVNEKVQNIESTISGENINLQAGKNLNAIGSDVTAGNNLDIKAGENVNIAASVDSETYEKHKSSSGFFSSKESVEVNYITKHNSSNISGNNISIESGKDTIILGSNIQAGPEGKAEIKAGENIIQGAVKDIDYHYKKTTKKGLLGLTGRTKSTEDYKEQALISNSISGAGGTIYDTKNNLLLKGVTVVSTGNITLKGKDITVKPIEEKSFSEVKEKKKGFAGGIGGGNISLSYDKSEVKVKDTIGSTIISENDVNLKTDKGDMNFTGTDIYAGNDININSGKDINISSGKEKSENKTSSQSVNGQINIVTGQISGGISVSEGESKSEINKNSNFYAENNIDISGKDMTVKGGNIEGEHIKIDVNNLHIESLQDKSSSSDKSVNVHGSSDNKNNTSTGVGMTSGKYDKEWVENQTSIIGRENSHITVEGNTHLEGGLLGGKDTTLNTGSLSFNDIKDHEKGTNIGLSENISKGQKDENTNDYTSQLDYSATDREQITHATVGAGTITVGGKEENSEGLNRDESKAQEITKDVTVDNINMKYDSERRDWNEVKDIMTEHGKNLGKDLDKLMGYKDGKLEKELSESFNEVYGEIEKIIDKDLKNEILGIIPTEATNGGIYGEPKILLTGGDKPYYIKYNKLKDKNGNYIRNENGEVKLEVETVYVAPEELEQFIKENQGILTAGNGIGNTLEGASDSAFNLTFDGRTIKILDNSETYEVVALHNPTNGLIADLIECAIGKVGVMMNSNIGAKDLTNIVRKAPSLLNGTIMHS